MAGSIRGYIVFIALLNGNNERAVALDARSTLDIRASQFTILYFWPPPLALELLLQLCRLFQLTGRKISCTFIFVSPCLDTTTFLPEFGAGMPLGHWMLSGSFGSSPLCSRPRVPETATLATPTAEKRSEGRAVFFCHGVCLDVWPSNVTA